MKACELCHFQVIVWKARMGHMLWFLFSFKHDME